MYNVNQYVSNELFHFVGRHEPTQERQFEVLMRILENETLRSTRQRVVENQIDIQEKVVSGELTKIAAICFCDIPRQSLRLHMQKYSQFGISFTKRYLASRGAKPVIYIPIKSRIAGGKGNRGEYITQRFRKVLSSLIELHESKEEINRNFSSNQRIKDSVNAVANEWSFLASEFYYFIKMYDEDLAEDHDKNYYMEREWRLVNAPTKTTLNFSIEDIKTVMVPFNFRYQLLSEFGSLGNRVIHP